jgi:hypothetical protein
MDQSKPKLYDQLAGYVLRRYQANSRKSMLDVYQVNQDFIRLEKDNLEFMYSNREGVISILDNPEYSFDLAGEFVKSSLEFTYNNNQYVHLNQEEQQRLLTLYHGYLQGMKTVLVSSKTFPEFEKDFSNLVKDHFKDLSNNISRFFDRETGWQIQENIILKQVVCSEYSPDFQLGLLGLNVEDLMQPVLDLGCGKNGTLVKYLRQMGLTAIGVDRIVEANPFLKEADWFDIEFHSGSWGTVISHMAFSNHFAFHHRYKKGKPRQYAQMYMQILEGLKPGGCFIYSPGLPFIEQYLPEDQFTVKRQDVITPEQTPDIDSSNPDHQSAVVVVIKARQPSTGAVGQ